MPSAYNALAGLRPTVGLVSRTGMVPLNSVRDTAGPIARTVVDMRRSPNTISMVPATRSGAPAVSRRRSFQSSNVKVARS